MKYNCASLFNDLALMERFKQVDAIGKEFNENNTYKYITMECKNDPTGGVPYWDPTYDHLIQPFPECVILRKYSFMIEFVYKGLYHKVTIPFPKSIMIANCFDTSDLLILILKNFFVSLLILKNTKKVININI